MKREVPSKAWEWTNLILGAGLACAAAVFTQVPAAAWNAGVVGLLVMGCSLIALYRYGAWTEWSNVTLGSWAAVAPFLLGFGESQTAMKTHVVIGLCIAAIAIIQLIGDRTAKSKASLRSGTDI